MINYYRDLPAKGELLATTSVFNFRNINLQQVAANRNSNINFCLRDLDKSKYKAIAIIVVAIGWSAHSASEVQIIGLNDDDVIKQFTHMSCVSNRVQIIEKEA